MLRKRFGAAALRFWGVFAFSDVQLGKAWLDY
jgi:hypothetical protein